jgi:flagellar biosynthesis protein FlhB
VRRVLPSLFLAPPTTNRKQQSNPPKLTTHPTQSHPSTQREKQGRKLLSRERKPLCACFVAVLVIWMSFASGGRELRGSMLSMLETHIVMSSLMFRLVLILMFRLTLTPVLLLTPSHMLCLTLLLVLCLSSLMDLTIAHMVLVHERTALSLDALVTAHVLIVVTVYHVGLVFLLEGHFLTLSRDIWTVHTFPIVVHVPIGQVVRCKGL